MNFNDLVKSYSQKITGGLQGLSNTIGTNARAIGTSIAEPFQTRSSMETGYQPGLGLRAAAGAQKFLTQTVPQIPLIGDYLKQDIKHGQNMGQAINLFQQAIKQPYNLSSNKTIADSLRKQSETALRMKNVDESRRLSQQAYDLEQKSAGQQEQFGQDVKDLIPKLTGSSLGVGLQGLGLKKLGSQKLVETMKQALLAGGIGAGFGAATSQDKLSGALKGAASAVGQMPNYAGLNALTNPVVDKVAGAVGQAGGLAGRALTQTLGTGAANVAEDNLYKWLDEQKTQTAPENLQSFLLGSAFAGVSSVAELSKLKKMRAEGISNGNLADFYDNAPGVTAFKSKQLNGDPGSNDIVNAARSADVAKYNNLPNSYSKNQYRQGTEYLLRRISDISAEDVKKMNMGDLVEELHRQANKQSLKGGYIDFNARFDAENAKPGQTRNLYGGEQATGYGTATKFSSMLDKKPRFEIDDSKARIKQFPVNEDFMGILNEKRLGDYLQHEDLFKNYPELKNVPVVKLEGKSGNTLASWDGTRISIGTLEDYASRTGNYDLLTWDKNLGRYRIKKTQVDYGKLSRIKNEYQSSLMHEIQHAIQQKEGFATGSSGGPNYRKSAGEVEARDVQSRLNLSPEQRLSQQPLSSQGIPLKEMNVDFRSSQRIDLPKTAKDWLTSSSGLDDFKMTIESDRDMYNRVVALAKKQGIDVNADNFYEFQDKYFEDVYKQLAHDYVIPKEFMPLLEKYGDNYDSFRTKTIMELGKGNYDKGVEKLDALLEKHNLYDIGTVQDIWNAQKQPLNSTLMMQLKENSQLPSPQSTQPVVKPSIKSPLEQTKPDKYQIFSDLIHTRGSAQEAANAIGNLEQQVTAGNGDKKGLIKILEQYKKENLMQNKEQYTWVPLDPDKQILRDQIEKSILSLKGTPIKTGAEISGTLTTMPQRPIAAIQTGGELAPTTGKVDQNLMPAATLGQEAGQVPPIPPSSQKLLVGPEPQAGSNNVVPPSTPNVSRVDSMINRVKDFTDNLYTQALNRFNPLEVVAKKAGKETAMLNALTGNYGAGSTAKYHVNYELAPILKSTNVDDLRTAAIAMRDIELAGRDIQGSNIGGDLASLTTPGSKVPKNSQAAAAQARLQELQSKVGPEGMKTIGDTLQKLYKYQDSIVQKYLVDTGVLSQKAYSEMRKNNQFYVPFKRVMDTVDEHLGMTPQTKGAGSVSSQGVVKSIKGSARDIVDPIESILENTYKTVGLGMRQKVAQTIVGLKDSLPAGMIKEIKGKVGNTPSVALFENGKVKHYAVPPEVADAAKGLSEESMNTIVKILAAPTKLFRATATGLNPEFMAPNVARDVQAAYVNIGLNPLKWVSGLAHQINQDKVYQDFLKYGGETSTISIDRPMLTQSVKEITGKGLDLKSFANPIKVLQTLGSYSEQPTRIASFEKVYNQGIKAGLSNEQAGIQAARAAQEATVNFARRGSKTQSINAIYAFLNARAQGIDQLVRSAKKDPVGVGTRVGMVALAPALALYSHNRNFKSYSDPRVVTQNDKDNNFIYMISDQPVAALNGAQFIKIPKGDIGKLANPIETFMSFADGKGGNIKQSLNSSLKAFSPFDNAGDFIPTALRPIAENQANYSFFSGQQIVPEYKKNLPQGYQYSSYTAPIYRAAGEKFGINPAKTQALAEGYGTGIAKMAAQGASALVPDKYKSVQGQQGQNINRTPVLRRFLGGEKRTEEEQNLANVKKVQGLQFDINDIKGAVKRGDLPTNVGIQEIQKIQQKMNESMPSGVTKAGNTVYFMSNGSLKSADTNFTITPPKLTGSTELDKKILSKFNGEITSKTNDILDLYNAGLLNQSQAETELMKLKATRDKYKAPKKYKLKALKAIKVKLPKFKTKKTKIAKLKKLKPLTVRL